MKKSAVVFLSAGLVLIMAFAPVKARPTAPEASGQSAETNAIAEKQFTEAVTLLRQENFSDAIAAYEKVIALDPKSPIAQDARYWIGQTYLRMGKYDEALSIFRKLLKDYPESAIVPVTRLMVSRVEAEKEAQMTIAKREATPDQQVIVDPATGAQFSKVGELTGKKAVVVYVPTHLSRSANGRFLLFDNLVIPLDDHEPFRLVENPNPYFFSLSPDARKVAYYADDAIWIVPISPDTGRPTGAPEKMLAYTRKYRPPVGWSPDSRYFTFEYGKKEPERNIWTFSVEDRSLKQITNDSASQLHPVWSGDGKTIAYMQNLRPGRAVYVVPAEGGPPRKILDEGAPYSWSPDTRWLMYYKRGPNTPALYRLSDGQSFDIVRPVRVGDFLAWSADGKEMFFYRSSYDYCPTANVVSTQGGPTFRFGRELPLWPYVHFWSPDSRWVVTSGGELHDQDFYVFPISGGKAIRLNVSLSNEEHLHPRSISPDGKRLLLFIPRSEGKEDLYVAPVSLEEARTTGPAVRIFGGRDKKPVGFGKRDEWAWSPDGKRLALVHENDIWVAPADREAPARLTKRPENEGFPVWSPDGRNIAFIRRSIEGPDESLWVMSNSGGEGRKIWDGCDAEHFTWSLDGREILVLSDGIIHAAPVSGGTSRQLLDLGKLDANGDFKGAFGLCWIPGGKRLAFLDHSSTRIFLVSLPGGEVTELATDDPDEKDWIYPSPDGKWISYVVEGFVKARPAGTIWKVKVEDLVKGKI